MDKKLTLAQVAHYVQNPGHMTQWEVDAVKSDAVNGIKVQYTPEPIFTEMQRVLLQETLNARALTRMQGLFDKCEAELAARMQARGQSRALYFEAHPKERNYVCDLAILVFLAAVLGAQDGTDISAVEVSDAGAKLQEYLPKHGFTDKAPSDILKAVHKQH